MAEDRGYAPAFLPGNTVHSFLYRLRQNCLQVAAGEGDPLQVCYWLATHTPLCDFEREPLVDDDLDAICTRLHGIRSNDNYLRCHECYREVCPARSGHLPLPT
jgi:hypothetical protein